jgi:hypothetical protein
MSTLSTPKRLAILFALIILLACLVLRMSMRTGTGDDLNATIPRLLRLDIVTSEYQFKNMGCVDEGHQGNGEFGFLSEISQVRLPNGAKIIRDGYDNPSIPRLGIITAVFLPADATHAMSDPFPNKRTEAPQTAKLREDHFIAYAWPANYTSDSYIFAVDQSGNAYKRKFDGATPKWNDLYGGRSWTDPPVWEKAGW